MDVRRRRRVVVTAVAVGVVAVFGTAGCAAEKNIDVVNGSGEAVTVQLGEEDLGEVTADGGVVLLGTTECYRRIVVTYAAGNTVELDGPICPGQTLTIDATTARITEATTSG